jgi:hypothetical protein
MLWMRQTHNVLVGAVLTIVDFEGNFVTENAKNTLTDNDNTACAVLLPE